MKVTAQYDVFVIGSGAAGKMVATQCAAEGLTVAIADNRAYGGTCSNRGCDPKKVLLGPTEVLEMQAGFGAKSILSKSTLDWENLQKFTKEFTARIPADTEKDLKESGVVMYHQSPRFIDERTLSVEGKLVQANTIVIATGKRPMHLSIPGAEHLRYSDDFLRLKSLPKRMVFVGAGYIGMEFAHIAARAGVAVTVIDTGERILSQFDTDLTKALTRHSEKLGIRFIFSAKVTEVTQLRKNLRIAYQQDGKEKTLKARMVFNTAGREAAINELDLEKGNVTYGENGIRTNSFLQNTGNGRVYACGDVSDKGLPLTPLSGRQGKLVAQNILNGNTEEFVTPVTPSVTFTLPHLAMVGLSEKAAKERYKNVTVNYKQVSDWFNAKRLNTGPYAFKVVLHPETDEILGAHVLGPEAGETINIFAMAIQHKITATQVRGMVFSYPSWANDIKSMLS